MQLANEVSLVNDVGNEDAPKFSVQYWFTATDRHSLPVLSHSLPVLSFEQFSTYSTYRTMHCGATAARTLRHDGSL